MPINSQQKGKRFEREIAKDLGGRRTPCSGGLDIKGDVRSLSGPYEHWIIECKNQERLNFWAAIRQARAEAFATVKNWCLIAKKNHETPVVVIDYGEWKSLVTIAYEYQKLAKVYSDLVNQAGEE